MNGIINELESTSALTYAEFKEIYSSLASPETVGFSRLYADFVAPDVTETLYIISALLIVNAKKFNLTSIVEPCEVIRKHIIDSLIPLGLLAERGITPRRMIDVGTGAGFPLLPMAAALSRISPSSAAIGLDATGKKIAHITECAEKCGLASVSGIQGRAEEISHDILREKSDLSVARAVAALPVLVELCAPLTSVGGHFVALKSHADDEIAASESAARLCGLRLSEKIDYVLPGGDTRTLVIYDKIAPTPTLYPRRYAEITKKPL